MKTLIYCTSYAPSLDVWANRHLPWIDGIHKSGIHFDQILIADDASPFLPTWEGAAVIMQDSTPIGQLEIDAPVVVYSHRERFGCFSTFNVPGWYRSFGLGAQYAYERGFDRVIHLESDARVLSNRLSYNLNTIEYGWWALWTQMYTMPEIAIQVAAGQGVRELCEFSARPYASLQGRIHELEFPLTHVNRFYRGDRYGEIEEAARPGDDFTTQVRPQPISQSAAVLIAKCRQAMPKAIQSCIAAIGPKDFADPSLFGGNWSTEPELKWMQDFETRVFLPSVNAEAYTISLDVEPLVRSIGQSQRLLVLMNENVIGDFDIFRRVTLQVSAPASTLEAERGNILRFLHPDAFPPTLLSPPIEDSRHLAFALRGLRVSSLQEADGYLN